ncbi:MAG TPA: ATP-binding protein, partial [Aminobacteriaceae bacterium]|nr:ATP-binding protein [Aminobacteriaceae bacterium]
EDTLIVFDEIQECPDALTALKYFCENAPEYHLACAGSLLGVMLAKTASFPVGKVDFLNLNPMTFTEFLMANGNGNLVEYLDGVEDVSPLPDAFFNPLYENLKMYFITGGMPESVKIWTLQRDTDAMQQALSNVLNAYERDFAKHPERKDVPKISMIWNSIPSQFAKENKKFLYRVVKEGARAREYEDALQWLCNSGLVFKTYRNELPKLPLKAYDDISAFKIYMVDTGLLRRMAALDPSVFAERERLFLEFNGALSENYIVQALTDQFEVPPRYWTKEGVPRYEVDFLLQRKDAVYPVEVKAGGNVESRSQKKYKEIYGADVPLRIRFSLRNLKLDGDVLN